MLTLFIKEKKHESIQATEKSNKPQTKFQPPPIVVNKINNYFFRFEGEFDR